MRTQQNTRERGFTLIELVVVIVIIGILAAFAIPRFAGLATDARQASARGMLGTVRSSSALVHGLALARNVTTGTVALEGATVGVVNSYPTAPGIVAAIGNIDAYTLSPAVPVAGSPVSFQVTGAATLANCSVTYTEAPANGVPNIVSVETGC